MTSVAEGPLSGQLPPDITHQANGRFGRGLSGDASSRMTTALSLPALRRRRHDGHRAQAGK